MPDKQTIKIFIASSAELKEEREKCVLLIKRLNNSHKHLLLDTFEWEIDMITGNTPGYNYIQKKINPQLLQSDIVVFMFYSRLGQYTKEEFDLAMAENKKLFAYFKRGFSPKKETFASYGELLDFKERLNATVLYSEYDSLIEFEKLLYQELNPFLVETYPIAATSEPDSKLSQKAQRLLELLFEKDEEIKALKQSNKLLPEIANRQELEKLMQQKDELQQQLQQSKEIQEQQAKDKAALEQQLSLQKEHDALKARALEEVEQGNYIEAEQYLKESAKQSIEETATTFYELGKIKKLQLQYKEAYNYFELAAKINPESSLYLHNAGFIADDLGLYDAAFNYMEKALEIDKKKLGEEHVDFGIRYNELGVNYHRRGEYDKAIDYYQQSLAICKIYYGEEHPEIATRYNNLGEAYRSKGEYDKAIDYNQQALSIDKKYHGEEHPDIAVDYNNLGSAYGGKGEYDKAIEFYQQALAIDKKYYGEKHPKIATRYNNLGSAYRSKGEYGKAIEYHQQALAIGKKYYGEEHPGIASGYNDLGLAYHNKGEYEKAIDYYNRSLSMLQKFLPDNHPSIQTVERNIQFAQQAKAQ